MTTMRHSQSPCRRVVSLAAFLVLAGCGSLIGPSNPAPQIYRLEPPLSAPAAGARVSWQLDVAKPEASQTLNSERIALVRGAVMDYYAGVQWNDTTPQLVQSLLVEAFERSGRVAAVAPESEGLRADYTLATEIRDFDAQYATENGAPKVVVEIEAKLLDPRGQVVATLDARHTANAERNSVAAAVAAFDQALGATLDEIVVWALQSRP